MTIVLAMATVLAVAAVWAASMVMEVATAGPQRMVTALARTPVLAMVMVMVMATAVAMAMAMAMGLAWALVTTTDPVVARRGDICVAPTI